MAGRLQPALQFRGVVDLAVLEDVDRAVLVGDRLVPGLEVDEREVARDEATSRVNDDAVAVGAAVDERRVHPLGLALDHLAARDEPANPAHC